MTTPGTPKPAERPQEQLPALPQAEQVQPSPAVPEAPYNPLENLGEGAAEHGASAEPVVTPESVVVPAAEQAAVTPVHVTDQVEAPTKQELSELVNTVTAGPTGDYHGLDMVEAEATKNAGKTPEQLGQAA
ncbi:hypothetical protein HY374_01545 [Candidatus Berkelbacteria bacterium]|nr:hypothetical protein [Candidatus Berkelbacteria bacterium]